MDERLRLPWALVHLFPINIADQIVPVDSVEFEFLELPLFKGTDAIHIFLIRVDVVERSIYLKDYLSSIFKRLVFLNPIVLQR